MYVRIVCNDCHQRSITRHHIFGHKVSRVKRCVPGWLTWLPLQCQAERCGSYNSSVLAGPVAVPEGKPFTPRLRRGGGHGGAHSARA